MGASTPLFHIVSEADWRKHQSGGAYRPPSLASEGFIHLSTKEQVPGTASLFFRGQTGLLLLELAIDAADPALRWEPAANPAPREGLFPHYYSALPLNAVRTIHPFEP
jgi:uncharacterized protein (DUF952 family)